VKLGEATWISLDQERMAPMRFGARRELQGEMII
jgi:hypothetical protein